jgi:endo-beta-N-acetylglucosaminidase D
VGDTIWEKTPLFDGGLQHFKSNFSVGIGCKFVENDGTILENYPWHVPNLVDIYPTYTWDIQKYKSSYDVAEKLGGYKGTMIFMMHIVKEIH